VCLILLAIDAHPRYPLIAAANRDEFYDRPTRQAEFWDDAPDVLAGRDLLEKGTWMGVTRGGRFCALTNVRNPADHMPGAPSRGRLVSEYLKGREDPVDYLGSVIRDGAAYNGFNLLVGQGHEVHWFSNRDGKARRLESGVHGLSNGLLNTAWPKVVRGKAGLEGLLSTESGPSVAGLLDLLADRTPAADADLPRTGVSMEWERLLSPIFISSPTYGTRTSAVLLLHREGRMTFVERTHDPWFRGDPDVTFSFSLPEATEE
jgi:uncharacterized protein with NRDE domain